MKKFLKNLWSTILNFCYIILMICSFLLVGIIISAPILLAIFLQEPFYFFGLIVSIPLGTNLGEAMREDL